MTRFIALALIGLLMGLWPRPTEAAKDTCIFLRSIDGFNVIDDDTLIVHTGPRHKYRIDLFGRCPGLEHTETIAIDSRDGRVCWPSNNHIITDRGQRCLVDTVTELAPPPKKDQDKDAGE